VYELNFKPSKGEHSTNAKEKCPTDMSGRQKKDFVFDWFRALKQPLKISLTEVKGKIKFKQPLKKYLAQDEKQNAWDGK